MNIINSQHGQQVDKGFRVDISRGENIGRVSSEWFSRPDDERYLSLTELYDAVKARADRATARTVESRAVRVEASREDAERLALIVPGQEQPVAPTHWSFGQLCSLVVCMNRNLWGVEGFEEISIRHSKFAATRFPLTLRCSIEHNASFIRSREYCASIRGVRRPCATCARIHSVSCR